MMAESTQPTFQKRDAPNFLYAALDSTASAPFMNKGRRDSKAKFRSTIKLPGP
jgi:hypothetical protein